MEYISSFVYCDRIQTELTPNGPIKSVVSPLGELRPISIPSNFSFAIAFSIMDYDANIDNHIKVVFLSPNDQIVITVVDAVLAANMIKNIDGSIPNSINLDLDLRNVVLKSEGLYKTLVELNGNELGKYPIKVERGYYAE